jgi:hypothetical protein
MVENLINFSAQRKGISPNCFFALLPFRADKGPTAATFFRFGDILGGSSQIREIVQPSPAFYLPRILFQA